MKFTKIAGTAVPQRRTHRWQDGEPPQQRSEMISSFTTACRRTSNQYERGAVAAAVQRCQLTLECGTRDHKGACVCVCVFETPRTLIYPAGEP